MLNVFLTRYFVLEFLEIRSLNQTEILLEAK